MHSDIGSSHHLSISDSMGRSVVVEYIGGEMIVTDTPVVTNHYLSEGDKFGIGNEKSHRRYNELMKKSDILMFGILLLVIILAWMMFQPLMSAYAEEVFESGEIYVYGIGFLTGFGIQGGIPV